MKKNKPTGLGIFTIVCIIIASIGAWKTLSVFTESAEWPLTSGIMKSSEVRYLGHKHDYTLDLVYSYRVNGEYYEGTALFAGFPNDFDHQAEADRFLKKYPQEKKVDVFYDPSDPSLACLETPEGYATKLKILMLVMFFLVIGCFYLAHLFMSGRIGLSAKSDW
jgi:hypothetical protein